LGDFDEFKYCNSKINLFMTDLTKFNKLAVQTVFVRYNTSLTSLAERLTVDYI